MGRDEVHWLRSGSSVIRELGIKRFSSPLNLQVVGTFCHSKNRSSSSVIIVTENKPKSNHPERGKPESQ